MKWYKYMYGTASFESLCDSFKNPDGFFCIGPDSAFVVVKGCESRARKLSGFCVIFRIFQARLGLYMWKGTSPEVYVWSDLGDSPAVMEATMGTTV